MAIWYLIFWSTFTQPFEGGQYQTKERCMASAKVQAAHYHRVGYIGLRWKCEVRISI